MVKKAVIDRLEGKQAVLMVEEKTVNVLKSVLPKGVKEGDWLEVVFEEGRLVSAKVAPDEKEQMRKRIEEKRVRLLRRR